MRTVNELLEIAADMKASDLHLTVGIPPKVRVFGELISLDGPKLLPEDLQVLAYSILPKNLINKFEEQGELDFSYSIPKIGRYRANVFHQRGSLALTIRLVGEKIPNADSLGIPEVVQNLAHKKRGLVLVTGPTGSGKTSTLASLIDIINQEYSYNIITLEDPIEYLHPHKMSIVNQREIGTDTKSFSTAITAALREDPDVILVGELTDLDTLSTALSAAETGHLVFATLHTIGAASTIERIIEMFPPHQQGRIRNQLSVVLEGVISQQLIPMTNNRGRKAAYEVMLASTEIRGLIREGKIHQINGAMQIAKKSGMQTMDDAIFELYVNRYIDREQAIGYAQNPTALSGRMFI